MKKSSTLLILKLIVFLTLPGCGRNKANQCAAPHVICESHYSAQAGTGFNLLEKIDIRSQGSSKTHVSLRGAVDNAVPGNYDVMLMAYDDAGNTAIRNIKVTIFDSPQGEIEQTEEAESEDAKEEIPEASPEPTPIPTQAPVSSKPNAAAPAPKPTAQDPYAREKQECASSYGTWDGQSCIWPAPEPVQNHSSMPEGVPSGGSTNCWQEGNMTVCEWVGEWEEYDD